MPLKTSASTPLLGSLLAADVETTAPLKRLHLRPFSGALGSRKVRSETDLQILDKDKSLRSSVHHKKSVPLKSMSVSREIRQFSRFGTAHASGRQVRDFHVETMHLGGGGVFNGQGGSAGGKNDEFSHSSNNDTDAYYQNLLKANPGSPLLLRNYARFLHEVKHDVVKSEEYYERAMLASPGDGDVLAMYAKLVWEVENDRERAEIYFDRAVLASPDDCYVLASHAHFLWNTEEEEEEERVGRLDKKRVGYEHFSGSISKNVAAA